MIIPENRYNYPKKKNVKHKRIIIFILLILLLIILLFLGLKGNVPDYISTSKRVNPEEITLEELWTDSKYKELTERCEESLVVNPLDPESLIYNGFALFHLGIAQFTLEDQLPLLDSAIINLRKALLLKSSPLAGKVNYILGKSYYHKGRYYLDQAIYHLQKSIQLDYINIDTYKYMGLCYSELGFYNKGIEFFLKADINEKDDMLSLVIGQTYHKLGDNNNSELYLKRAIEINDDFRVEIKSRFLLGKIFFEQDKLQKAEEQYILILDKDIKSADAHYYLGEIYEVRENIIKARAEWRKALELDPSHYGALLRLY
ncbi:MAG: tetratricopeptide repeat protein, partial [Spirochaetales bacterium]|nr:tetratricopeptide repeat protein [Spirochaetales bacterium]